jgi:hypothetical protein
VSSVLSVSVSSYSDCFARKTSRKNGQTGGGDNKILNRNTTFK